MLRWFVQGFVGYQMMIPTIPMAKFRFGSFVMAIVLKVKGGTIGKDITFAKDTKIVKIVD